MFCFSNWDEKIKKNEEKGSLFQKGWHKKRLQIKIATGMKKKARKNENKFNNHVNSPYKIRIFYRKNHTNP